MSWLDILTIIILLVYILKGWIKGFIKTIFSMFAIIVSIICAMIISPYVSNIIQKNENMSNYIHKEISNLLDLEKDNKKLEIQDIQLPQVIQDILIDNNTKDIYNNLNVETLQDYIIEYLYLMIINILSFLITYLIIYIALLILITILDLISKLPLINGVNKIAGIIVGFVQGLIVIWILGIFLTIFGKPIFGADIYNTINSSFIFNIVYNNNILLDYFKSL